MDGNYRTPRRISVLPLAVAQVAASLLLAVSTRTGYLHIGVFLVAVATAAFAIQSLASGNYIYFISAALSVCGAFLIGGVFPAAMSAFAVPAGLTAAYMLKKRSTKISVTVALEILYAALFTLTFLAVYLLASYELSVTAITEYIGDIVDVLKQAFIASIEEDEEVLAAFMKMMGAKSSEELLALIDAEFKLLTLIMPAMLISVMGIIAYLTSSLIKLGARVAHCEIVLPDPKWETVPSRASAVIYSLSYVLYTAAAIFSGEMNVFLLACYSIVIVLTPLMLLMGVKWIRTLRNKVTVIVLFVFGTMFMADLASMILAFFGVREIFLRRDAMKESEKENDREI